MLVRNDAERARVTERDLSRQESLGLIFATVPHLHRVLRRHMAEEQQTWSHKLQTPTEHVPDMPGGGDGATGAAGAGGWYEAFMTAVKGTTSNEMLEGYANAISPICIRQQLTDAQMADRQTNRQTGRQTKRRPPSLAEGKGWQPFCLRRCPSGWRAPRSVTEAAEGAAGS